MTKIIRLAGIDIGSNAIRLLIKEADLSQPSLEPKKLQLYRVPLRLGSEAFSEGKISKPTRRKLVHLMKAYHELMTVFEVEQYRACATSAMREAINSDKIISEVYHASGIRIEVISGEDEAQLVSDIRYRYSLGDKQYVLFVDVGGGSTELNLFEGGTQLSRASFNIGTVRILTGKVKPETFAEFDDALRAFSERYTNFEIVGTGGNINKLVRLANEEPAYRGMREIKANELSNLYDALRGITPEERMRNFNLKPDRADVIVPAAYIFLRVLNALHADKISVPTAGLADGIIYDLYKDYCAKHHIITDE